jgi:hypothetical protein
MAYLTANDIAALQLDASGQNTTAAWQKVFEELSDNNSEVTTALLAFEAAVYSIYGEKGYNDVVQAAQKFQEMNPLAEEVSKDELKKFGFTQKGISRIKLSEAVGRLDSGKDVYVLYPDNTKKRALNREELREHGVMFGMPTKEANKAMDEVGMER